MNTGILYIVATPIGNLGDITFRAVEIFKEVDLIICEDTRVTRKLLEHYGIKTETKSFYKSRGTKTRKPEPNFEYIIRKIKDGKNVALATDAGTPGISDPGNQLVEAAIRNNIKVVPIPGPSALAALASAAGIDMNRFVFLGYPPHKKGRETYFKKLVSYDFPIVYYESPYRLIKNLELLSAIASEAKQSRQIILGRELTKMFEEIVRGSINEVLEYFNKNRDKIRGEIAIIVY